MSAGKYAIVGILVFIGMLAATLVSGLVNGLLFSIFPMTGTLALVGQILSFAIFAFILGFVIVWLLAKFA